MKKPGTPGTLTGTRLRDRRLGIGLKQADLARQVGISPAYLNLIEHNRRRIGGKLLNDLARVLGVEPAQLSEGTEAALLGLLQAAATRAGADRAEQDRAEEFAGRFPGWAGVVAAQHRRIRQLEHTVEALTDRLTHDPHLAASLHEVLTAATAIRSAVSILTDDGGVDPEWQARFLRNVAEDSARLADSAGGLARFLDAEEEVDRPHLSPQEELGAFLARHGHAFAVLEPGRGGEAAGIVAEAPELESRAARMLARDWLNRYRDTAQVLPAEAFGQAWDEFNGDPVKVAARFGTDAGSVLRRVLCRPGQAADAAGLAVCDGAGAIIYRKELPGFSMPRFAAACPRWPLYQALTAPGRPLRTRVVLPGAAPAHFACIAVAQADYSNGLSGPPVVESTMLVLPDRGGADEPALPVGPGCRVCAHDDCPARREPSILTGGAG